MTSADQPVPPPAAGKAAWRSWAKALRARLAEDEARRTAASAAASGLLAAWAPWRRARRALVYLPLGSELDPQPPAGPELVVPRIVPGPEHALSLHPLAGARLETVLLGLRQPTEDAPLAKEESIDLVLLPGLAFDRAGRRLGYGGGYYDRLLARAPAHWLLVGVCWDELLVEALPHGPLDMRVDWLLTPSALVPREA